MTYQVEITPAAKRQIKKLVKQTQELIIQRLEQLAENPRPSGVLKMEGEENLYRVRVADYRIIYEIQDQVFLVIRVVGKLKLGEALLVFEHSLSKQLPSKGSIILLL